MGKHEPGTAKAIANKLKARGLQKLRWYCQMCEKQCRDENGFKCHCLTAAHQRNMQIFASNSTSYLSQFSADFQRGFLDILSRRHNTKRTNANVVYNEYIQDKEHVHMNATKWTSLSQFVQHLGEQGLCKIDQDERGWFVQWINRDLDALRRASALDKKRKHDQDDEARRMRQVQAQVRLAQSTACSKQQGEADRNAPEEVDLSKAEVTMRIASSGEEKSSIGKACARVVKRGIWDDEEEEEQQQVKQQIDVEYTKGQREAPRHKLDNAMRKIVKEDQMYSKRRRTADVSSRPSFLEGAWVVPGLIVKVVSKKVDNGRQKNRKGKVLRCEVDREGHVRVTLEMQGEPGSRVSAKQSQIETVLPDLGKAVLLVSKRATMAHRGARATLVDVDVGNFCAKVRLPDGTAVSGVEYDNLCKIDLDLV
ncbi:DNA/RNA-binding protein KIN17 (Binding to curved DNA) (KIN [Durusdinium trenchii]|uniref:Antigenic determinant of recA protein n=1 Tax=Durusdinium trenchii TaxID=1381693 RepID=A0ABP0IWU8_9DINO